MPDTPETPERRRISRRIWDQFTIALQGNYTPVPNSILDGRVANRTLPLEIRFDALIERKSLGNWSLFACERNWDTGEAKPLDQAAVAKLLGVDRRRVSALVNLRQKQGLHRTTNGENSRLIQLALEPAASVASDDQPEAVTWESFSDAWDAEHGDLVRRREELLAQAEPFLREAQAIRRAKLAAFKAARKEAPEAAAAGDEPAAPEYDEANLTGFLIGFRDVPNVPDSLDSLSGESRTVPEPAEGEGIGNSTRARAVNVNSYIEDESVSQSSDRPTDQGRGVADKAPETAERMGALLLDELGELFPGEVPGRSLCLLTAQAMGDAPWHFLIAKIRRKKWKPSDTMGLVLHLAHEVRERWIGDAGKRHARERDAMAAAAAAADEADLLVAKAEYEERCRAIVLDYWRGLAEADRREIAKPLLAAIHKRWAHLPAETREEMLQREVEVEMRPRVELPTFEEFLRTTRPKTREAGGEA